MGVEPLEVVADSETENATVTPEVVYDFDQAVAEVDEQFFAFKYGGEDFRATLSPDAGDILKWMEHGSRVEAVPQLLRCFLSEEDYQRMISLKGNKWPKMEALVNKLATELGGQSDAEGNPPS